MSDLKRQLQDYAEANVERVDVDDVRAIISQPSIGSSAPRSLRPAWAFVLAAAFVLAVGAVAVLLRDTNTVSDDAVAQPEASVAVGEQVAPSGSLVDGVWNPILAVTEAGQPPPAATCPIGSTRDELGPFDQLRPWGASWSNQAAAFDQHGGRIIFVDSTGETWAFDVCTNTWEQTHPTFVPPSPTVLGQPSNRVGSQGWSGQLVYDVDSDVTISFMGEELAIYDAAANTWTHRPKPAEYDTGLPGFGAVYHPESGLVVLQTDESGLVAYNADTDTWTPIGMIEDEGYTSFLVGHLSETDQLAFLGHQRQGLIVNPRTGEFNELRIPFNEVFAGFGRLHFATSGDTAYFFDSDSGGICRLDPPTLAWNCIGLRTGPGLLAGTVRDPINDRVVLIYGYGDGFNGQRFYDVNDIWAVDFNTREWTLLLERSGEMTFEQED